MVEGHLRISAVCWRIEMIEETDIDTLARYLLHTWGLAARDFVAGRIESSDQAAEWRRVAAVMDGLLAAPDGKGADAVRRRP
jgi:hypothetical protein